MKFENNVAKSLGILVNTNANCMFDDKPMASGQGVIKFTRLQAK